MYIGLKKALVNERNLEKSLVVRVYSKDYVYMFKTQEDAQRFEKLHNEGFRHLKSNVLQNL